MRVLSLDPGVTTGYAFFVNGELEDTGTIPQFFGLFSLVIVKKPDVIVCEGYHQRPVKFAVSRESLVPVEVIGAAKFLCSIYEIPFIEQTPAAKKLFEGEKLKQFVSLWPSTEHERDAVRHGLVYLKRSTSTGGSR